MKIHITFLALLATALTQAQTPQTGIGTSTPHPSAALEIASTTTPKKGVMVPRLTEAQKTTLGATAAEGLLIYQTDKQAGFWYWDGTKWVFRGGKGWETTGNVGTTTSTNKIGTTDAADLKIVTNNSEKVRVASNGAVGIGTSSPSTKLHINTTQNPILFNDGFEDNTLAPFTTSGTGGSPSWTITTTNPKTGTYCAQSGNNGVSISSTTHSYLDLSVTLRKPGTISFWVRVSCHDNNGGTYQFFAFYIGGTKQTQIAGNLGWMKLTYPLAAGTNTLRWHFSSYSKRANEDRIYVDDVKIEEHNALAVTNGTQAAGRVLKSDADGVGTWQVLTQPSTSDNDWLMHPNPATAPTLADDIYHQGPVTIGKIASSPYTLHVHNGGTAGSKITLGSVETLQDGINEFIFEKNTLSPITDGGYDAGSSTNRWINVWSFDGVLQTSDERMKTKIQPLQYGIKEILKLRPVSFKWKNEMENHFRIPDDKKNTHLGFIAQDLQTVLPEIVQTHEWKEYEANPGVPVKEEMQRLAVSYSEMIPVLTKAIQEQQSEIEQLEKDIKALEELTAENERKRKK